MNTRYITIGCAQRDDAQRTAPCTLSTEYPVDRGSYLEVLSHDPEAVDLSRAPLPLIEGHDPGNLNIGVIENLRITGRKLRGTLRLGTSARANEIWSEIKSGIIRNLSVGYEVLKTRRDGDTIIATRWQPLEASLVSIPADPNAGVFRSKNMNTEIDDDVATRESDDLLVESRTMREMNRRKKRAESKLALEERERVDRIHRFFAVAGGYSPISRSHNNPAQRAVLSDARLRDFIESGTSIEEVHDWYETLPKELTRPDPVPSVATSTMSTYTESAPSSSKNLLRHFGTRETAALERSFIAAQWVRGVLFGNRAAQSWLGQRGLVGYDNSAGGVLVPSELAQAVLSMAEEHGIARAECTIWPMSSQQLTIPRRREGLTAHFLGEIDEATESQGAWDNILLNAKKIGSFVLISNELVEDAAVDLAGFLADEIARVFAEKEDSCLFQGDGTLNYGGIVGLESSILGTPSAVPAAAGHNTLEKIDAADLRILMAKLPQRARKGAKWYCSPIGKELIFGRLLDSAGGNTLADLARGGRSYFAGYEIVESEFAPNATGSLTDRAMLYFGNLQRGAAFGDRREIRIKTDESRYLTSDQVALFATQRFDINVHGIYDDQAGEILALTGTSA